MPIASILLIGFWVLVPPEDVSAWSGLPRDLPDGAGLGDDGGKEASPTSWEMSCVSCIIVSPSPGAGPGRAGRIYDGDRGDRVMIGVEQRGGDGVDVGSYSSS